MIGSLFFVSTSGEIIVERHVRDKVARTVFEDYWAAHVAPRRSLDAAAAVTPFQRYTFFLVPRGDMALVAATAVDTPPMFVLEVLHMVLDKIHSYFGGVSEDIVRENFSTIYQLLDELLDGGFPLITESHVLKELVPPPTLEHKVRTLLSQPKRAKALESHTVPWRDPTVKHTTNEFLIDVIESLDLVFDAEGGVVHAAVRGAIDCTCKLSGSPDVVVTLRNSDMIDDVAYHRCVRHARYESDRTLSFVPPEGKFTLFRYHCKPLQYILPPFYVTPQVTCSTTGGRINVMVGLRQGGGVIQLEKDADIHRLVVSIPLPVITDSVTVHAVTSGSYAYNSASRVLRWTIGSIGTHSISLSGEFTYLRSASADAAALAGTGEPVTVDFSIPGQTISPVRIDTVNIMNEAYKVFRGVKYTTKAGHITIRTV